MNAIIGGSALAVAGTSVVGSVASGVVVGTANILSYLWNGSSTGGLCREYHRRIIKLDIPDKVLFITELLKIKISSDSLTAKLMESGIKTITDQILQQLSDIQMKLSEHKDKWFNGYRNLYIDEELKDLESLVDVLDKKMKMLEVT
jgi:hypothetical protein